MNLSRMSFLVLLMMGTTFYVNGVTTLVNASSSQTLRSNKAPINHCNCHCTVNQDSRAIKALVTKVEGLNNVFNNKTSAISDAVKSMEAKMESLTGPNNKTFGVSNGLEAKVERLTGLDNKTSSISYAVRSLDAKVEGLTEMSNKTSSISNAVKVLEAKVEGLRGLVNNKTFSISDAVKSLEKKVEALTELNSKTSSISGAVKSLEKKVEGLTEMINKTSGFSDAVNTLDAKMENIIRLINRTLFFTSQQPTPKPTVTSAAISSCQEQYLKDNSSKSQVFTLKFGLQTIPVYCHMGDFGCGGGGWTPVMKTDGTKRTFQYTSCIWTNKNGYNFAGGKTGFDTQETKLPTYWETNFSKICLGMKIGNQTNFIAFNKQASSLYSLIADGLYRSTSLGRNSWKALLGSQASLQRNCNREGFNTSGGRTSVRKARARIGILGNNENDCGTVNSRIGFGMQGIPDDSITCGVAAKLRSDNGDKFISSFGYILVQ